MSRPPYIPDLPDLSRKIANLNDLQIRMLMSSIFAKQDEIQNEDGVDKELLRVRDLWLRDEEKVFSTENCVDNLKETMRVMRNYFAERGLVKDSLKENGDFSRYIISFLANNQNKCAAIMHDFADYACQLSLRPAEQWGIYLEAFPPQKEYLKCLDGTKERIEKSHQALTTSEQYKPFLQAHNAVIAKMVGDLKDHVEPGNETHIPSYLEYALGLRKEKIIYPQSQMPTAVSCKIHAQYSVNFRFALFKEMFDPTKERANELLEVLFNVGDLFPNFDLNGYEYSPELSDTLKSGLKPYEIDGKSFEEYDEERKLLFLNEDLIDQAANEIPSLKFLDSFLAQEKIMALAAEPEKNWQSVEALRGFETGSFFPSSTSLFSGDTAVHIVKLLSDESEPINHAEKLLGLEMLWMMGEQFAGNSPITFMIAMVHLSKISPDYLRQKVAPQIEQFLPNQVNKIEIINERFARYSRDVNIIPADNLSDLPMGNLFIGNAPLSLIKKRIDNFPDATALVVEMEESLDALVPQPKARSHACKQLMLRSDSLEIFTALKEKLAQAQPSQYWAAPRLQTRFMAECLMVAASHNDTDLCKYLLENFETKKEIFENTTIMHSVARHDNVELAGFFIEKCGKDNLQGMFLKDRNNATPAVIAAAMGNVAVFKAVYDEVEGHYNEVDGGLALIAASRGHANFIKLLGTLNYDLVAARRGSTAAHNAVKGGHENVILALKEAGVSALNFNQENKDKRTPMELAIIADDKDMVLALGDAGVRDRYINLKDSEKNAPIHLVASEGRPDLVPVLRDLGADLNAKNKYGDTAVHIAINNGNVDVLESLVKAGADLTLVNIAGKTPLIAALERHNQKLVDVIGSKIDLNQEDERGHSLIYRIARETDNYCVIDNRPEDNKYILKALLAGGADINYKNKDGDTAAHLAVRESNLDAFNLLASLGADLNQVNKDGESVIYLAVRARNESSKNFSLPASESNRRSETEDLVNFSKKISKKISAIKPPSSASVVLEEVLEEPPSLKPSASNVTLVVENNLVKNL